MEAEKNQGLIANKKSQFWAENQKLLMKIRAEERQLAVKRFWRNRLAVGGLVLLFVIMMLALLAPVLVPFGPYEMDIAQRLIAPNSIHIWGTDTFGRDVFIRVAYGARVSLMIGIAVSMLSCILGMMIGLYASYYKILDNILMRLCDGISAIPSMLLAIAFMAILGASATNVIVSLSLVFTPSVARITRSRALAIQELTYIEAMKSLGASSTRIIWLHIAPNLLSPVIVQTSFIFAKAIITEAALSFLGVGVPVPVPSLGNILYEAKTVITKGWWLVLCPGIVTALYVLGLNMLGDGLRDALDPRAKY